MTDDGYIQHGYPLINVIRFAYLGYSDRREDAIKNAPLWVTNDLYTIDARIADVDLRDWQAQTLEHRAMLQAMLRSFLADRCKLVVHRSPAVIDGWALVQSGSGAPGLRAATKDEVAEVDSRAGHLKQGGWVDTGGKGSKIQWTFNAASMDSLTTLLSAQGVPVENRTGLMGRYDFVLRRIDMDAKEFATVVHGMNLDPEYFWDLKPLGLNAKPLKFPAETVVIDHIDRPSPN